MNVGCSSTTSKGTPAGIGGGTSGTGGADAGHGPAGDSGPTPVTHPDTRPCGTSTLATGSFPLPYQGTAFKYLVHVPPSYDGTKRTPLVLDWHALLTGSPSLVLTSQTPAAAAEQALSGMDKVSDEEGFIVVYPDSPTYSWDAGTCCLQPMPPRDDVGFARALVDEISKQACIDSKRIYTTGMSNGGIMSQRLACEAADLFAASAPVAGKVGIPDCSPSRPIPIMEFHGTADGLAGYDTGSLSGEVPPATVPETIQHWATRDGCTQGPDQTYQQGTVTCQTWSKCKADVTVTLCTATGGALLARRQLLPVRRLHARHRRQSRDGPVLQEVHAPLRRSAMSHRTLFREGLLAGRVAIVTGGATGIGLSMAGDLALRAARPSRPSRRAALTARALSDLDVWMRNLSVAAA
jgi:polyhydroxybutyrate depolymerase